MASQLCQCPHSVYGDEAPARLPKCAISSGDVYTVNESVCTPIYDILRQPGTNLQRTQHNQSQTSFLSVTSALTATRHENGRPCIIMEDHEEPSWRPLPRKVCLVTTYSGRHISTLPKIFREFSVPVYPHYAVSPEGDDPHVHSMPKWSREDAWIIAWVFKTRRPLIHRMQAKREIGHSWENLVFGEAAMEYLVADCKKKRKGWMSRCKKNPNFAGPIAKEFFDHRKDLIAAETASKYSLATQATCRTAGTGFYKPPMPSRAGY